MSIGLGFAAAVVAVTLWEPQRLPYRAGQRISRPIVARVDFTRPNKQKSEEARQNSRLTTSNFYSVNETAVAVTRRELLDLLAAVQSAEAFDKLKPADIERWKIDKPAFAALSAFKGESGADAYRKIVGEIEAALRASTMVRQPSDEDRGAAHAARFAVLQGGKAHERKVEISKLWIHPEHNEVVADQILRASSITSALRGAVRAALLRVLSGDEAAKIPAQAPYAFDAERTRRELAKVEKKPDVVDQYKRGHVLAAPPGEITEEHKAVLEDEHKHYLALRRTDPELHHLWIQERAGRVGLVLFVVVALAVYTVAFQPRVVQVHTRALGLAGLVIGILVINRLFEIFDMSPGWSVLTATAVASVITLTYNQRFALGVAVTVALFSTLMMNESISLYVVQVAAAATAAIQMAQIRTRLRVVLVGLITGFVTMVVASSASLLTLGGPKDILSQSVLAGVAAMLGVFLVFILLPLIERTFRLATALTLMEWADTNQPLLRQFIQKAPGTWQHSHLLANMGEAAAEAIAANGLLVRVGALYHDIGKIRQPEYFVENQPNGASAHARLSPQMSLLVILGHVKDGLALAREHKLPSVLHRFIAEHHGTTIVKYFYNMATRMHAARGGDPDDREIDENEFRYPGPKPSSKETAILMICDSVEGAVRTLQDPTPGRIEAVVHQIIMARLMDGQFDECDLTLKELHKIELSLVKSLNAIYHGRIAYPKAASEEEPEKAEKAEKSEPRTAVAAQTA